MMIFRGRLIHGIRKKEQEISSLAHSTTRRRLHEVEEEEIVSTEIIERACYCFFHFHTLSSDWGEKNFRNWAR
jgi:hypothetical protein